MAEVKKVLSGYLRAQHGYSRSSSVAIDTCSLCFCEPGFEYRKGVPSYTDLETLQILGMRLELIFTAASDCSSCIGKKNRNSKCFYPLVDGPFPLTSPNRFTSVLGDRYSVSSTRTRRHLAAMSRKEPSSVGGQVRRV
jgi:hypothetical protein